MDAAGEFKGEPETLRQCCNPVTQEATTGQYYTQGRTSRRTSRLAYTAQRAAGEGECYGMSEHGWLDPGGASADAAPCPRQPPPPGPPAAASARASAPARRGRGRLDLSAAVEPMTSYALTP